MFVKMIGENVPELFINPRMNISNISKKMSIMKWYISSHLVVPIVGIRQAAVMMQYFKHFKYNAKLFQYPVLLHTGSEDKVVDNKETKKFYDNLGSKEKQMFEYEGSYHELQYEDSKTKNTNKIIINIHINYVKTKININIMSFEIEAILKIIHTFLYSKSKYNIFIYICEMDFQISILFNTMILYSIYNIFYLS